MRHHLTAVLVVTCHDQVEDVAASVGWTFNMLSQTVLQKHVRHAGGLAR